MYISFKITFSDIDAAKTSKQSEMRKHIEEMRTSLFKTIDEELKLLSDGE